MYIDMFVMKLYENFYHAKGILSGYCDCSGDSKKISPSEFPKLPVDDTGVYFMPAEEHFSQTHLNSDPFVILNPISVVPKSKSRFKKEFDSNVDFSDESSMNIESNEKTETFLRVDSDRSTGMSPSYLDLEIEDGTNIERPSVKKFGLIEDIQSTERSLVECLNLHIIDYTRKYGTTEKIKEYWETKNFKIYDRLSNHELIEKMREFCSHPELIVEQSFHDIKKAVPKKGTHSFFNYVYNTVYDTDEFKGIPLEFTDFATPASYTSEISTSGYDYVTEIPVMFNQHNNYYESKTNHTNVETTYEDLLQRSDDNNNLTVTTASTSEIIYNSEERSYIQNNTLPDMTGVTTENIFNITNSQNSTTVRQKISTEEDSYFDLDNMASEVKFRVNSFINDSDLNVTHIERIADEVTVTYPEVIVTGEITLENSSQNTDKNVSDITAHESSTAINDISTTPVTTMYTQNRILYKESDIKIPKIVTKECINQTIQTVVYDYEKIPNSDFINSETETQFEATENYPVKSVNNEKDLETLINSENIPKYNKNIYEHKYDITGNLYFGSSQELVPVHLHQADSGKISLGIDGDSLCDKLFPKMNKKSVLLTTLCECVQYNKNKYNGTHLSNKLT